MSILIQDLSSANPPVDKTHEEPSHAELAIWFGHSVRARLRLCISIETIALSAGVHPSDCEAAVQFAEGPDWLKFRALVEDWSWAEIKRQVSLVQACEAPTDEPPVVVLDEAARSLPNRRPTPRPRKTPVAQVGLVRRQRSEVRRQRSEGAGEVGSECCSTDETEPRGEQPVAQRLSRQEIRRRLCHMLPGLLAFALAMIPHPHPLPWGSLCRVAALAAILTTGVLAAYRMIARVGERQWLLNAVSYPATILITLLMFPAHPEFAAVVLVVLAFGDGGATLMGMLFGRRPLPWNPAKTWVGSLWFLLLAAPAAAVAYWLEARPTPAFAAAMVCGLAASLVAGLAESLPAKVTDNLRVGVAAAVGVVVAQATLGG